MKNILINKDFLPKEYVINIKCKNAKEEKRGLYILTLIALILLPFSLSSINIKKEVKIKEVNAVSTDYTNKEEVLFWASLNCENLMGTVNKNNGSINVNTKEKLEELSNNEKLSITNIYYLEGDKYKVELTKR